MQVNFVTPFKNKYQRNNKQTGKKNLRCFPCCHPVKHMNSGFCGQPVKVTLYNCNIPANRLRCWAIFETVGAIEQVANGAMIKETDATKQERTRQNPMNEWMRGNVYSGLVDFDVNGFEIMTGSRERMDDCVTVVVNSERMGYHYGWNSNKNTCDVFHVMKLYVFQVIDANGLMECIGNFSSPPFQIFCRRRLKKAAEDNSIPPEEVLPVQELYMPNLPVVPNQTVSTRGTKRTISDTTYDSSSSFQAIQPVQLLGDRNAKIQRTGMAKKKSSEGTIKQQILLRLMEFICFKDPTAKNARLENSSSALEDFSSNLLGGIVYGLDFENPENGDVVREQMNRDPCRSLGSEFSAYLLEENSFTERISNFFQENACGHHHEAALSHLFHEFMDIVEEHVQGFLKKRGMTMEEFQNKLDLESRAVNTNHEFKIDLEGTDPKKRYNSFKIAFLTRLRSEIRPAACPVNSPPIEPEFDITGTWLNSGESHADFERANKKLADRGYPVFVFQMIRSMLWRFRVTITGDCIYVQGEKKLMHSGEFVFKIDDNDHPFEIPHVIPLGMPPIPCMYRAHCRMEDGIPVFRCIIHGFFPRVHGVRFEISRTIWILENRQVLQVLASFDIIRGTSQRECLASFSQRFFRTSGEEDMHELLDFTNEILKLDF